MSVAAETSTAGFFAVDPMERLREEIVAMIIDRHRATPRHQQKSLGPSEIGHPCARKLASGILDLPAPNPQWDPLPSIIGTATHTWLETAADLANANLGRERWLTETKVHPAAWLSGSCDLYDTDSGTVVDYKVPGANQFDLLRREMSMTYRVQTHLYGKGFQNAGHDVQTVAIMLIPRGGTLSKAHLWHEPYDARIADAAIARYERVASLIEQFDVEHHPERIEWFAKEGYQCVFCPWFSPKPCGPTECGGEGISPPIP